MSLSISACRHRRILIAAVAAAAVSPLCGTSRATTYTWVWNGAIDYWNQGVDWSTGTVPGGANTDVLVFNLDGDDNIGVSPFSYNNLEQLNGGASANELILNNSTGSVLTIAGDPLTFVGNSPQILDTGSGPISPEFGDVIMNASSGVGLTLGGNGTGVVAFHSPIQGGYAEYPIDGTGELLKTGSSTYVLADGGTNGFTGPVVIQGGTLQADTLNDANTNGAFGNDSADPGNLQLSGGATIALTSPSGTSGRGMIIGDNGGTLNLQGGSLNLSGQIESSGTNAILNLSGSGTLTLSGSSDNSFLGVTVNGGTLILAKSSSTSVHAIGGPLLIYPGATVQLAGTGGDQIYTAVTVTNDGAFDLNGQNEGFENLSGYGAVINSSTTPSTLTVGENTTVGQLGAFFGTISSPTAGAITLNKTGAGTFVLGNSADNSFLAATVSSGTLVLGAASSSSVHAIGGPLVIDSGAIVQLQGTGGDQIYTAVTVTDNGTFDLNGNNEGFEALTGSGTVTDTAGGTNSILTLGENTQSGQTDAFSGSLGVNQQSPVALVKVGGGTLTLAGSTDNSSLSANVSAGTLVLAKTSSSSVHAVGGPLIIDPGATVQLGGTGGDQIYTAVTVTDNGTFDLNGNNEGFEALAGSGTVINSSASPAILTVGENTTSSSSSTFSGNFIAGKGGGIDLTLTGAGTFYLAGSSDNDALTATVNGGTLVLDKYSSASVHAVGYMLTINSGGTVLVAGSGEDELYYQANVVVNSGGTFNLNQNSVEFDGLSGAGTVTGGMPGSGNVLLTIGANNDSAGPASSTFSGTLTNGATNLVLQKVGAGTQTMSGLGLYSGGTFVADGTLVIASAGALPASSLVYIGGTLQLAPNVGAAQISSLDISSTGVFDLTTNGAIIESSGDSLSTINSYVATGYANGKWNGPGIDSSTAAADTTHLTALGVIVNDNGSGTPLYGPGGTIAYTFDGHIPTDGEILVKYTYYGDANLDGVVDASDYSRIDNGYLDHLTGWANGDFNYDGVVNGSDYTLIDNAFNMQGASLQNYPSQQIPEEDQIATATTQIAATAAVPEPAMLSLLSLGVTGAIGRRRRRTW